jgi:predicted pyridoxine 5'-phosphate oxidase superfamily flavin-nucleotide-binding protein
VIGPARYSDPASTNLGNDMLSEDMKRVVSEQRLGFVATVNADGSPNLSPKGTFVVIGDDAIAFGEIRSPQTLRNLKANPAIEVNFVDPFVRKGYRFAGRARIVERGDAAFESELAGFHQFDLVAAIRAIVTITVTTARPITSPAYDRGRTEAELRRSWTRRFRQLQPAERFEE